MLLKNIFDKNYTLLIYYKILLIDNFYLGSNIIYPENNLLKIIDNSENQFDTILIKTEQFKKIQQQNIKFTTNNIHILALRSHAR